jgi:hypothetical protein
MKDEFITMHGMNEKLLMKVTRTKNRLYKIKPKVGTSVCLQSKTDDDAWRWHARLGLPNFDSMKQMSKKELARGLPLI